MTLTSHTRHQGGRRSMGWRRTRCAYFLLLAVSIEGCGGANASTPAPGPAQSPTQANPLVFVGFDASEPLVDAMRHGKIQGLVVQNPLRMGELSVKTMIKHLENKPVA